MLDLTHDQFQVDKSSEFLKTDVFTDPNNKKNPIKAAKLLDIQYQGKETVPRSHIGTSENHDQSAAYVTKKKFKALTCNQQATIREKIMKRRELNVETL